MILFNSIQLTSWHEISNESDHEQDIILIDFCTAIQFHSIQVFEAALQSNTGFYIDSASTSKHALTTSHSTTIPDLDEFQNEQRYYTLYDTTIRFNWQHLLIPSAPVIGLHTTASCVCILDFWLHIHMLLMFCFLFLTCLQVSVSVRVGPASLCFHRSWPTSTKINKIKRPNKISI